jgi:hypothetical protein
MRDVLLVVLPNHRDGPCSRRDLHVTQLQASAFFLFYVLFGSGWLGCNLKLSNEV